MKEFLVKIFESDGFGQFLKITAWLIGIYSIWTGFNSLKINFTPAQSQCVRDLILGLWLLYVANKD